MTKGGAFYAIWDEREGIWTTSMRRAEQIIDADMREYIASKNYPDSMQNWIKPYFLSDYNGGSMTKFVKFVKEIEGDFKPLDQKVTFASQKIKRTDYRSKRLPYDLDDTATCPSYEELTSVLYSQEERNKYEWAVGAILSGHAHKIQKFLVFYGAPGAGKSTILDIISAVFGDHKRPSDDWLDVDETRLTNYCAHFDAEALANKNDQFSTEVFKHNPIVGIQHDGDLSRINDNTKLNAIISHETLIVNEKCKAKYPIKLNTILFMASNKMVKITDAKSGIIRRLIDVNPTGKKIEHTRYDKLIKDIYDHEIPGIAQRCINTYRELGTNYYDNYRAMDMMYGTDPFINFIEEKSFQFSKAEFVLGKATFDSYKEYCNDYNLAYIPTYMNFREQLKSYFEDYKERWSKWDPSTGQQAFYRHVFFGFLGSKLEEKELVASPITEPLIPDRPALKLEKTKSKLDYILADCPAQYANKDEYPFKKWDEVDTTLKDIDTKLLHYVRPPENMIIIDFDLKDENGNKSKERNLQAAAEWPPTYAEFSKGGGGLHLHYYYNGDTSELSRLYSEDIEIKVFSGKSSLRRRLSFCNDLDVATFSGDLPKKEGKKTDYTGIKDEQHLRALIAKALKKEIHPATKPSVDYIYTILEEFYATGKPYSVTDMKQAILTFASQSSHQSDYCIKLVGKMKFQSENFADYDPSEFDKIIFLDCEIFPNLFLVNWKLQGEDKPVLRMINPGPEDMEKLFKYKIIGYNNRAYDNHMLYACYIGYSVPELYDLSQRLVNKDKAISRDAKFAQAYNLSYADVKDYYGDKFKSLKQWEIELNIHHEELGLPWDQPVPEETWDKVAHYCDNDVISTEAVFNATQTQFTARKILADLAGKSVNTPTNSLTTTIILGQDKKVDFNMVDMATGVAEKPEWQREDIITSFPGYTWERGDDGRMHNMYRGTDLGTGGYVYAEPGMYQNVALLDVASLHPHSILAMNSFGKHTQNYADILKTRILIKHHDFDAAKQLFGGKLAKYLDDPDAADQLSKALKLAINSVYGLTCATFETGFTSKSNYNNVVALRGALFMRTLQDEVVKRGFKVAHIKTDSIKIPDATPEIISFCMDFAKQYGYEFEHEATYERMCLVNNAVYIAKYKDGKHAGEWTATGAQFQHPYVFKHLFSKEPIIFEDLRETKTVQTKMYLDFNEDLPEDEHNYHFIGKVSAFCPVKPGTGGGVLLREQGDKYNSVTGAKGYRWREAEQIQLLGLEDTIDYSYYKHLTDDAIDNISNYCDFEWFAN